jgi:putative transposase
MPLRKTILATGETYHIFNRSLRGINIFSKDSEAKLFLMTARYYLQKSPAVRFSYYRKQKDKYKLDLKKKCVRIVAYCVMPNHFHFILTQLEDNGIKDFIRKLTGSYSHYINKRNKQKGTLFESRFNSVRVETEEQLIHLSRYIHLNPVSAYLVEKPEEYKHSSYNIYLEKLKSNMVEPGIIMSNFRSKDKYEEFVLDRKDYQRSLADLKNLVLPEC